jgi:LysR family transcriptional regulator, glycine cleavage system transcriptional activator
MKGTSRRLPPIRAISVFEAAARHESFTRAAEELGMTQAAVSYQIKRLEQRLALTLFQRASRRVVLTRAGEQLAPVVIEAFESLRNAFACTVERSESELAITSLPTIGANWLVPRLGAFQLAHPQLAVRLETSVPLVDLEQGEFDVSIRNGRGEWPGMIAHLLLPGLYTPLCSPGLVKSGALTQPADLLRLPRMGRERWWREWLQQAGVQNPDLQERPGMELSVEQFEVTAAIAGHGVAITSPLFFQHEIAAGRLVQPFGLVLRDERDYWLAYPESRRGSAKIRLFREWLLEEARRTVDLTKEVASTSKTR